MDFAHPILDVIPGAKGRVLSVLAETTAPLSLRTVGRSSGVSAAQVSRVMPELVRSGLVERSDVPPSSLFRLVREHVAAKAILDLAAAREAALGEMSEAAAELPAAPVSVVVFGSFARGEADPDSDVDVVFVRPSGLDEDDETWADSVEQWRERVVRLTGNPVEILEVSLDEAASKLSSNRQVWRDIRRDGRAIRGLDLTELAEVSNAQGDANKTRDQRPGARVREQGRRAQRSGRGRVGS